MHIYTLRLRNYRNYSALELAFDPNINVFLGPNAQGKTNVVEAVYYASLGRSHRTSTDNDLISWEMPGGSISLDFDRLGVQNKLDFQFSQNKRRRILLNEHPIRPKDLVGNLNTVLFSPEDLFLIKGAPAGRRRFLDGEISQASPAYYHELQKYGKIVTQRNNLLKKIRERQASMDMLELWEVQLVESAVKIVTKRLAAVKKLNMLANLMQRRISGNVENLAITYDIHGAEGENVTNDLVSWYNKELDAHRQVDILRGSTGRGPHLDDIILTVNGINLRSFGSQGQQRTGVLSLKLAELEFLRSETGEYPVLLLDDVMSELDVSRRTKLLEFIRHERIQTMITATDEAYFPAEKIGTYYRVAAGVITR